MTDYGGPNQNVMDGQGYGIRVAGTIAAEGNNNQGVIGVAPEARLMGMKGLNNFGMGAFSWLANFITIAAAWEGHRLSIIVGDVVQDVPGASHDECCNHLCKCGRNRDCICCRKK